MVCGYEGLLIFVVHTNIFIFFVQLFGRFIKSHYLCTAIQGKCSGCCRPDEWKCGNSSVGRAQPCQGWGREFESRFPLMFAQVAELVDAHVSGACVERCAGSSPVLGTYSKLVEGEVAEW